MELRTLRYFLAAAQEESITRAAERLHLTQPNLSRQLRELEEELGAVLFLRGRGIVLTEEGRLFRKRAEEMMELLSCGWSRVSGTSTRMFAFISPAGTRLWWMNGWTGG